MVTPYITKEEIRLRLSGINASNATDELLEEICIEVTDVVNMELGFEFDGYTEGERVVFGYNTPYLTLPAHNAGTITEVRWGSSEGSLLTDWVAQADGTLLRNAAAFFQPPYYPSTAGWGAGAYVITGEWGFGAPPPSIKKVCLELAINTWRAKDKGLYTDIIGVEGGGGIRYIGGFNNQQQHILDNVKAKYLGGVVFA